MASKDSIYLFIASKISRKAVIKYSQSQVRKKNDFIMHNLTSRYQKLSKIVLRFKIYKSFRHFFR